MRADGNAKQVREKEETAVTKLEEIRQKEANAESDVERRNGAGGCADLLRKRYPLMHGTFNSILHCGGRHRVILMF